MKKIILLIVIIIFMSGCYDYRELNNMAVIDGIAIDYKENNYIVKLEVVKSKKGKDGNEIKTEVLEASDEVLAQAFYKATKRSSNETYLGHVSLLVLSEELARNGINDVIDYVLRDIEISNDYSILISNNIDLFDMEIDDESISQKVNNILNVTLGEGNNVTVDMVGNKLLNRNIDLVIPYLSIVDEELKISKIAYFDEDRLKNIIDNKIYNFLVLDNIDINFYDNDNVINIYDKDIKYDIKDDVVYIDVSCNGKIMDVSGKYDLNDSSSYKKLESIISKNIKSDINKFLKEYKDLIGINDVYYKKYNKNKDITDYVVDVNLKINKNGAIYEVLNDK